jgi:hypothetical protein
MLDSEDSEMTSMRSVLSELAFISERAFYMSKTNFKLPSKG